MSVRICPNARTEGGEVMAEFGTNAYDREVIDRLAEHDREVAEKAWDAGFDAGRDDLGAAAVAVEHGEDENPYRQTSTDTRSEEEK